MPMNYTQHSIAHKSMHTPLICTLAMLVPHQFSYAQKHILILPETTIFWVNHFPRMYK